MERQRYVAVLSYRGDRGESDDICSERIRPHLRSIPAFLPSRARVDATARLPSRRRPLVPRQFPRAHRGAGGGVAVDPCRQPHPGRRADRLGQDAHRVSRRDRRTGARRCGERRRAGRHHQRALRVAAEGAVQRHPHQSGSAAGRHPRRAREARPARRGDPHRGAHRRHPASRTQPAAQAAAAHPGDHAGIAVRAARFGLGPFHVVRRAFGDRRRDPRHRRQQARLAPGAIAGAAGVAVPAAPAADRLVGDAETHRNGCRLFGRCRRERRSCSSPC